MNKLNKWDYRFLDLAMHVGTNWSKDPSTKVGAVIVNADRIVVGMGYNGFPRGVADHENRYNNRDLKYKMVVHGEPNAILNATQSVKGCTIYTWPFPPCNECAKFIIQAGIKKVIAPYPNPGIVGRWGDSLEIANKMFAEAGVEFLYDLRNTPGFEHMEQEEKELARN